MKKTHIASSCAAVSLLLLTGTALADQLTLNVTAEAQIRQTIVTDIDETTLGYLELKASTSAGASSGRRKDYFLFDLTGQSANTNAPAIFTVTWYTSSGRQRVKLWALDQAYAGFSSALIWDSAQANNTNNDQMLTSGSFTATAIAGTETTNTVWGESGTFTIAPPWGQFLRDNKIILALTGVPDSVFNGGSPARIYLASSPSPATFSFTTRTGDQPPMISSITNSPTVVVRRATVSIPFQIGDDNDPAASLNLSASTSNEGIVPVANVVFGGSGSNRTVTVTGGDQVGTATVTVYVSDSLGQMNQASFSVTTTPDPVISVIPHTNTLANTAVTVPCAVSSAVIPAANLTLSAVSGSTNLVPDSGITFGGSGADRTVTVNPASGAEGLAPITVWASDGTYSNSTAFGVMVLPAGHLKFVEHFSYDNDGELSDVSAKFWSLRTTGTRMVNVTNQEVWFYGPLNSSYGSVVAPVVGGPYVAGQHVILYYSIKASWSLSPRDSTGPFVHFYNSTRDELLAKVHTVTNGVTEGKFRLGIAAGPGNNYVEFPRDLDLDTAYSVISRYDMDAGTTALWIDAASEADPNVAWTNDVVSAGVASVGIRNRDGMGLIHLDDLKVAVIIKPTLTRIAPPIGGVVEIQFTGGPGDTTSDFEIQRTASLPGAFGTVAAPITAIGGNTFKAVAPGSGDQSFYRVKRKPLTF